MRGKQPGQGSAPLQAFRLGTSRGKATVSTSVTLGAEHLFSIFFKSDFWLLQEKS